MVLIAAKFKFFIAKIKILVYVAAIKAKMLLENQSFLKL